MRREPRRHSITPGFEAAGDLGAFPRASPEAIELKAASPPVSQRRPRLSLADYLPSRPRSRS